MAEITAGSVNIAGKKIAKPVAIVGGVLLLLLLFLFLRNRGKNAANEGPGVVETRVAGAGRFESGGAGLGNPSGPGSTSPGGSGSDPIRGGASPINNEPLEMGAGETDGISAIPGLITARPASGGGDAFNMIGVRSEDGGIKAIPFVGGLDEKSATERASFTGERYTVVNGSDGNSILDTRTGKRLPFFGAAESVLKSVGITDPSMLQYYNAAPG